MHDITSKEYYDKFMKKSGEGICKNILDTTIEHKETFWKNMTVGYYDFCSSKCCNKVNQKDPDVRAKRKATHLEKYGDENYVNYELAAKTKMERYGYEYFPDPKKNKK